MLSKFFERPNFNRKVIINAFKYQAFNKNLLNRHTSNN